jgi:2-keto-4-pentenoate hydratase/2-oxohepta-3-ene-1,7-dioic acid hydratase in catechol pathway
MGNKDLEPLPDVRVLTPSEPRKFIGLWNNFRAAAEKQGNAIPEEPLYFIKGANCHLADGGVIRRPASYDGKITYEGELGVVIGRRARNVALEDAESHIFGYTCVNDVTALDLIGRDPSFAQWTRAKSFDTFGPIGPAIATGLDWRRLVIRTLLNGRERQNYPANDMIFGPPALVSMISREMTLEPGDVITCGTSLGVLPLRPGATVEIVIDGIGVLKNAVE